jgi:hypothetical protein
MTPCLNCGGPRLIRIGKGRGAHGLPMRARPAAAAPFLLLDD